MVEITAVESAMAGGLNELVANHRWYAGFLILLFYGVREGEVLGLRWCDIDQ